MKIAFDRYRLLFVLYLLVIIVLSVTPTQGIAIGSCDKLGHFSAYFILSVLMFPAVRTKTNRIAAFFCLIALGAVLEWIQSFVPGRDMSIYDEITNTTGVVTGVIFGGFMQYLKRHRNKTGKKATSV